MTGIALIEIACWDIVGQALGQPRLPAARRRGARDRIKAYANGWYTVERTPDEFYAAAKAPWSAATSHSSSTPSAWGFYEIDRKERNRAISLVEAVRDAVGPDGFHPDRDARTLQPGHRRRYGAS